MGEWLTTGEFVATYNAMRPVHEWVTARQVRTRCRAGEMKAKRDMVPLKKGALYREIWLIHRDELNGR